MAEDGVKLGTTYIDLEGRLDKLESSFKKALKDSEKAAKGIQERWRKTKLDFDNSLGKKRISELQVLHSRLKAKMEQKIQLNVSASSLASTRSKLQSVESAMGGVSQKAGGLAGALRGALPAIGVGAVIGGITQLIGKMMQAVNQTVTYQDTISDLSRALDINANTIRNLDYIMKQDGGTIDQVSMGFNTLYNMMQQASQGGKDAEAVFARLGVSIRDEVTGAMRSGEDVFLDTIDSLHGMTDKTQRAMVAQDLFGRSWKELMPVIEKGRDGINKSGEELDKFGVKLNPKLINDHMEASARWSAHMAGMKTTMAEKTIPWLDKMRDALIRVDEWLEKTNKKFEGGLWDPFGIKPDKIANPKMLEDWQNNRFGGGNVDRGQAVPIPELADLEKAAKYYAEMERAAKELEQSEDEVQRATSESVWKRYDEGQKRAKEGWALDNDLLAKRTAAEDKFYSDMGLNAKGLFEYRMALIDAEAAKIRDTLGPAMADAWKAQKVAELPAELENLPSFVGPRRSEAGGAKSADFTKWSEDMKANIFSTEAVASQAMDAFEAGFSEMWGKWAIFSAESIEKTGNDFQRGMMTMVNSFQQAVLSMISQYMALKAVMAIGNMIAPGIGTGIGAMFGAKDGGTFVGTGHGVQKVASFAAGGSFTVPNGFSNDRYPMFVSSGERVDVTPAGAAGRESRMLAEINKSIQVLNLNTVSMQKQINVKADVGGNLRGRDLMLSVERSTAIEDRFR